MSDQQTGSLDFSRIGLAAGAAAFIIMLFVPAPAGLESEAWRTAAVALLMAVWWMTEALPIPATSLLPIVLFPLLGIGDIKSAAAPYAHDLIFLFMGGFLLALAMERWNLHRRTALLIMSAVGSKPTALIGGVMLASALLSMWVSNTATALMLTPIAVSLLAGVGGAMEAKARLQFGAALMLAVAYGANIGGIATPIGTPPNGVLVGFLQNTYDIQIGFAQWMLFGVPLVLVALPLAFLMLTRVIWRIDGEGAADGGGIIERELENLGPFNIREAFVTAVFGLTALGWILRPEVLQDLADNFGAQLSDAGIAVTAGVALFIIPAPGRKGTALMNWEWAVKLPWGILLLFGGGLSLAAAIKETGLADWIGAGLYGVAELPVIVLILIVAVLLVFLTEITSNTATTNALVPITAALAVSAGQEPTMLAACAALGASCAFMLPVATPPNAVVYGSGEVSMAQMIRAGLYINFLMIAVIVVFVYFLLPAVL